MSLLTRLRRVDAEPGPEPAEGGDDVTPPTDGSPEAATAEGEGQSSEEPAEGAEEKAE